jgi:VIT1/CCC1 family predicted Fe2+/Mn2+ transporter
VLAGWPGVLDFWDWAEAVGKGLLVGGRNGLVASCCAAPAFGAVLFLLFAFVIPTAVTSASTYFLLVCSTAGVVGVIVGTVTGMNEARREAAYKRVHNSIFRS